MIKCKNCNNEISNDDLFCRFCGEKINIIENESDLIKESNFTERNDFENEYNDNATYEEDLDNEYYDNVNHEEDLNNEYYDSVNHEEDLNNEYYDSTDCEGKSEHEQEDKSLNKIQGSFVDKINKIKKTIIDKLKQALESINKNKISLNKTHLIALSSVLGLSLILFIIFGTGSGSPLNEDKLKNCLVNQEIIVADQTVTLTEENIKNLTITSRNTTKKQSDEILGTLEIDLGNVELNCNSNIDLVYDKKTKSWNLNAIENEITSLDSKNKLDSDTVKELLANATISDNKLSVFSRATLTKDMIKEVSDITVTNGSSPTKKRVNATLIVSNNIVQTKINGVFDVGFNLSDGQYTYESEVLRYDTIGTEQLLSNLSDDDKKNAILNVIENEKSFKYEYEVNKVKETTSLNITRNNITQFNINNFAETEDEINAVISGEASNGALSKIVFSGTVSISKTLMNSNKTNAELTIHSLEIQKVDENFLKNLILNYNLDSKTLTNDICDTLKIKKENSTDSLFEKSIVVNLKIDKKSKKVQIDLTLVNDNSQYLWKIKNVSYS